MMKKLSLIFLSILGVISCKKDEGIPPSLSFTVNARAVNETPFIITPPLSDSDGSFSYTSSNSSVASISGNIVTINGIGETTIIATQSASGGFSAGTIEATFKVLSQGQLEIGQWHQGGVIFYLNSTGGGLVISDQDVAYAPWSNGKLEIVGTAIPLGTGLANTDKIITSMGGEGDYAAWWAKKYNGAGYTDWYLPSVEELAIIRSRKDKIG